MPTQKDTYYGVPSICSVPRGRGEVSGGQDQEGVGNSKWMVMGTSIFEGEENILGLDRDGGDTTL